MVATGGIDPENVVYPFDVTPAMETWVDDIVSRGGGDWTEKAKLDSLHRAMFQKEFGFEYDDESTLTADEAFDYRRGNYLSFTALFVALARTAGVDTFGNHNQACPGLATRMGEPGRCEVSIGRLRSRTGGVWRSPRGGAGLSVCPHQHGIRLR
jgi:hypothetical protein